MSEINRYYTTIKPTLDRFAPDAVASATLQRTGSGFSRFLLRVYGGATVLRQKMPWLFISGLFVVTLGEIFFLKILLLFRRKRASALHEEAKPYVPELVRQYPFGTYVVVWKAIQLPHLRKKVAPYRNAIIVEAAIGEGTLSNRVFDPEFTVTGLDINPVSLLKAARCAHLKRSVVCDCMEPPLQPGAADLLISNNFLHHITDKKAVLQAWSKAATHVIFNDCTPLWSEALPPSYLCHQLGLHSLARRIARTVDLLGSQSLLPRPELEAIVSEVMEIEENVSYFSRFTFFLANILSICFLHMGPVPVEIRKALAGSFAGRWADALTIRLCQLLIDFDQTENRDDDVSILFVCKSKNPAAGKRDGGILRCACGASLPDDGICLQCGKKHPKIDGMLFVLPDDMAVIAENYDPKAAAAFPGEHL